MKKKLSLKKSIVSKLNFEDQAKIIGGYDGESWPSPITVCYTAPPAPLCSGWCPPKTENCVSEYCGTGPCTSVPCTVPPPTTYFMC